MNIPYVVLRTDIAGEEDWSIAVRREHVGRVPKGFVKEPYQAIQGGGEPYEKHWPYTEIRYFTPSRDRLDEIQLQIATGELQHKFSSPLGDTYEGTLSLKESIDEEKLQRGRYARARRYHQANLDRLHGTSRAKYKEKAIKELKEDFDHIEIAKILGMDVQTVKRAIGAKFKSREEMMIQKGKQKRLARSMYAKGESLEDIATWLDVVPETVKKYLGSKYNGNRDSDLKMERVLELTRAGLRCEDVGKELGMHRTTVRHYLRRHGKDVEYVCDEFDPEFKSELEVLRKRIESYQSLAIIMKCNQAKIKYYMENDS